MPGRDGDVWEDGRRRRRRVRASVAAAAAAVAAAHAGVPPPPPLPPALAAGVDATPTMTLRLDGDPATFDETAFVAGVAAAAGGGAAAADVVVEGVRSGSVLVDFHVAVPGRLFPAALGGRMGRRGGGACRRDPERRDRGRDAGRGRAGALGGARGDGAPRLVCRLPSTRRDADLRNMRRRHVFSHRGRGRVRAVRGGIRRGRAGHDLVRRVRARLDRRGGGNRRVRALRRGYRRAGGGERGVRGVRRLFLRRRPPARRRARRARRLSFRAERVVRGDAAHARGRRFSAPRSAAVDRAGCVASSTRGCSRRTPCRTTGGASRGRTLAAAAATFLATVGVCAGSSARTHWSRQRLLVKYAGGETFYEEMIVASASCAAATAGTERRRPRVADFRGGGVKAGAPDDADRALDAVLARHPRHARVARQGGRAPAVRRARGGARGGGEGGGAREEEVRDAVRLRRALGRDARRDSRARRATG